MAVESNKEMQSVCQSREEEEAEVRKRESERVNDDNEKKRSR